MANTIVSSGYKELLDTPLGKGVVYAGQIIDRNYEEDMLHHITNGSVLDPLMKCGQVITFERPPNGVMWKPYETNQLMIPDQPSNDSFCITVCEERYASIKVDKRSIARACEDWDAFETGFLTATYQNLSELWHDYVLTGMQLSVANRNLGKRAGRYGNIDLGSIGQSVHLTPDNIVSFFARMRDVLQDAGRWYEGEMFITVPRPMEVLLLETMFAKQLCCNTGESVLFKGMKAHDILGFTVVATDRLRPILDPATRRLVYPVVAGWNEAYAFAGDIVEAEIQPIPQTFGVTYNMLSIYGGGAIYPEALAKAYVTFSTNGTVAP